MGCILSTIRTWCNKDIKKKYEVEQTNISIDVLNEFFDIDSDSSDASLEIMAEYVPNKDKENQIQEQNIDEKIMEEEKNRQDVNNILRIQNIFMTAYIEQEQFAMRFGSSHRLTNIRNSTI